MAFENMGTQLQKELSVNVFIPVSVQHIVSRQISSFARTHSHSELFGSHAAALVYRNVVGGHRRRKVSKSVWARNGAVADLPSPLPPLEVGPLKSS